MKKILKYAVACFVLVAAMAACTKETTPERINIQFPDEQSPIVRDNAYYQNLRAYKQTKHKVSFGWYGSWTAIGVSYQSRLISAPDSMDIISIWSQWHTLTPEQIADKETVQKVMGTKVLFTIFAHEVPKEFLDNGNITDEVLAAYAKAYAKDSMDKYNYDGIDLDYEPQWGGKGPLVDGVDAYWKLDESKRVYNPLMTKYVQELSKWVGPASGTGKLLVIDGVPFGVDPSVAQNFDYGIVQAYASSKATGDNGDRDESLQGRFNKAYTGGWRPEQYIFTENFESYWQTGGVTFTDRAGNRMPSLLGMAAFNPVEGAAGGFGSYHMEYEYGHSDMPYKYMRQAIQKANPAGGWKTPIDVAFSSTDAATFKLKVNDDGTITGTVSDNVKLSFTRPVVSDMQLTLGVDNSLVKTYNDANGTKYQTVDPTLVKITPIQCKENQVFSPQATITLDPKAIANGYFLIPVVIDDIADAGYKADKASVHYIIISKGAMEIDAAATTLDGVKIASTPAWTINCYQGTASSGATGVWNLDSDAQKAAMFDGLFTGNYWYGNTASWSWGNGGNFIIDMGAAHDVTGFRWHIRNADTSQCVDFTYSEDGKWWVSLTAGTTFTPAQADKWKYFKFKKTVKARYIRVFVGKVTSGTANMDEAEVYGPAN